MFLCVFAIHTVRPFQASPSKNKKEPPALRDQESKKIATPEKSPGTLLRSVRGVSGEVTAAYGEGANSKEGAPPVARTVSFVDSQAREGGEAGGNGGDAFCDPSEEISDIDRRLNQLQEFLRQAKQGGTVNSGP